MAGTAWENAGQEEMAAENEMMHDDDKNQGIPAHGRRRHTSYNSMIRRWDREGDKAAPGGQDMHEARAEGPYPRDARMNGHH